MKKISIWILLTMMICLMGCQDEKAEAIAQESTTRVFIQEEEKEMDMMNRTAIASALQIEENSRCIRFILASLNDLNAGIIQEAELVEEDGNRILKILAEDGNSYGIYLSQNNGLEGIKNLETNEWLVTSEK